MELLKKEGLNDVLVTGGGIIPNEDMVELTKLGVGKLFAPGAHTNEISDYIKTWVTQNRQF
jgi:methylmalonyl-CoA mutase C-terminal domain/subunit